MLYPYEKPIERGKTRKANMKIRNRYFAIFLAALLCVTFLTGCAPKRTTAETEEITFGVDVAKYQGVIDWQQVADSGIDFAMVRVGYRTMADGELREDPSARYNLQEASRAGVSLGVYFFSTAVSEEEAKQEAEWVIKLIAPYPITYPVVYDCEGYTAEDSRQNMLTKAERTDIALAFLATVEEYGYEGMFYSSRNELHNEKQWDVSRIDGDYKIWVAQYPEQPYPQTEASSYYGLHHMWQYTTEGNVPGIPENVDMNIAYFGYDGIEKPRSKKTPEVVAPDLDALMDFRSVDEQVTAKESTNLRNVPSQGEDSHVLFTLQNGQQARRIGVSSSGWSKLEYEGLVCYAVSSYLTSDLYGYSPTGQTDNDGIETEFTPVSYQVTAKEKVNLRRLPSVEREDATVITQLVKGDIADCVGVSDNGWSKLNYKGTVCYAVSSYLTQVSGASAQPEEKPGSGEIETVFEPITDRVTAKKEVNLRRKPSVQDPEAVVVATIYAGDIVQRTGINRDVGWSRVVYNGEVLYCVSSYIKVVSE